MPGMQAPAVCVLAEALKRPDSPPRAITDAGMALPLPQVEWKKARPGRCARSGRRRSRRDRLLVSTPSVGEPVRQQYALPKPSVGSGGHSRWGGRGATRCRRARPSRTRQSTGRNAIPTNDSGWNPPPAPCDSQADVCRPELATEQHLSSANMIVAGQHEETCACQLPKHPSRVDSLLARQTGGARHPIENFLEVPGQSFHCLMLAGPSRSLAHQKTRRISALQQVRRSLEAIVVLRLSPVHDRNCIRLGESVLTLKPGPYRLRMTIAVDPSEDVDGGWGLPCSLQRDGAQAPLSRLWRNGWRTWGILG
jgi:hypothetical protein